MVTVEAASPGDVRGARWSETAEQSVLGAIVITRGAALVDLEPLVSGRDFYSPAHEEVWDAMLALWGRGEPTDEVTVPEELSRRGSLARTGGPAYLHTLLSSVPSAANAAFYARIVREHATFRRLASAGVAIAQMGAAVDSGDADEVTAAAYAVLEAASAGTTGMRAVNLGTRIDVILDRLENPRADEGGIPWPWIDVNRTLRPAAPGQVIIVSGRPGAGKSTLTRNVASHAACTLRKRVLLHAMEQSTSEVEDAILSSVAGVNLSHITECNLDERDWTKVSRARDLLDGADLIIDDTAEMTIPALRSSIRRHRPDVVIIDQIQHMIPSPGARSREEAVGSLSREIKRAASAEHVPIIAVSKMNRASDQRSDKKPQMSDLRESGNLESDADAIILVHREDMYEKESPRAGEADIIIPKNRRGPVDTCVVAFQGHYQRFVDMATE